jgi:hypothetical protein
LFSSKDLQNFTYKVPGIKQANLVDASRPNWSDTSKKPPFSRRFQKIQAQQKQLTYLYMILLDCLTGQFLKDLFFLQYIKKQDG